MKNNLILKRYAQYIEEAQFSPNTIETYTGQISRFYLWRQPDLFVICPSLERDAILHFKAHLLENKKLKPVTVNGYLSALRSFNEFLVDLGLQSEVVVRNKDYMKIQSELSNPWDGEDEEVERLLRLVRQSKRRYCVRDYAILSVMAYAGLRVSEVVNLDVDDIMFSSYELFVRNGKGQKSRTVYMNNKVIEAIEAYMQERPIIDEAGLFISQTGNKLTRRRIQQIVSNHSDTLTPHKLRHFFCSQSQSVAGYSIMETAQQAGHRNPQTTMRYSHPRKKDILAKANKL